MFTGEHQRLLDEKGRLSLPPNFRRHLMPSAYLTRSTSAPCLYVFSHDEIQRVATRLKQKVLEGEVTQNEQRRWTASVHEVSTDTQGRMAIPSKLREFAGLDREIALIGIWDRAEIWDAEAWSAVEQDSDEGLNEGIWL